MSVHVLLEVFYMLYSFLLRLHNVENMPAVNCQIQTKINVWQGDRSFMLDGWI